MFINYEDIKDQIIVDVRTIEEFNLMKLCKYNVPIINKNEHDMIKKFYPVAIFVILNGFIKNKITIRENLLSISENKTLPLVIACSQGRLRSPIVCLYARFLGIDAYILNKGIKHVFGIKRKHIKNLFGFLDI